MRSGVNKGILTSDQCRAGRALLRWSQRDLADRADVTKQTVANLEQDLRKLHSHTVLAIRKALENGGVEFLDSDGQKGEGVRHKTP